ncbi:MAG TPA: SDR family oxidoreductase [Fimbriimonadaceae bacterium]|jgi:NAD(P)-dependent dehydrogenase (short-subunit alcohol dehydrogenase family)
MGKAEVVVITGATAGIGRATARRFGAERAKVALLARGEDRLQSTKEEIERAGGQAIAIPTDVADPAQIEAAAEQVEKELGPIDIWINNAMTAVFAPVWQMEPEEYKRVTEVTYLGQVYGALAALKRMRTRNKGKLVFVGSALAYRGIPLQSSYGASKHAIQGFVDSLRTELLHENSGIDLTMVQLSGFNTPQFSWVKSKLPNHPRPLGACFQPEVAAEGIFWAAHHKRRELMIGFPAVEAIYGNKLLPQYADWMLSRGGFEGQQTDQPVPADRPNNLWEPVPGNFGAHGIFEDEAKENSPQLALTTHRKQVVAVAGSLAALGLLIWKGRKALKL